jgi:OFA family oxalate/formate antiporter-like MFS transporter
MTPQQRWPTLVASVIAALSAGLGYSWSVLLRPMAGDRGWSDADVSLTFSAFMTMGAVAAIVAGKLQQYLEPRTLVLLGGALFGAGLVLLGSVHSLAAVYAFAAVAGFGMGTVYPGATMSNLLRFFPDRSGFASGMLSAGAGLGAVVWAPLAVALIARFDLAWALRILGVVFFIALAVLSRMIRTAPAGYAPAQWTPPHERPKAAARPVRDVDWKAMMRTPQFVALFLLFIAGTLSGMMVIGHGSPIAQQILGIAPAAAGAVVSLIAVGMVAGKIVWGAVSDRIGRSPVFVALFVIAAAALITLAYTTSYPGVAGCMAGVAFCYGGFLALMGPVTADDFGSTYLGVNFGIMFFTVAVSSFVGPRIAAMVAEADGGSFSKAFLIAAAISLLGLVLVASHAALRRRTHRRVTSSALPTDGPSTEG